MWTCSISIQKTIPSQKRWWISISFHFWHLFTTTQTTAWPHFQGYIPCSFRGRFFSAPGRRFSHAAFHVTERQAGSRQSPVIAIGWFDDPFGLMSLAIFDRRFFWSGDFPVPKLLVDWRDPLEHWNQLEDPKSYGGSELGDKGNL